MSTPQQVTSWTGLQACDLIQKQFDASVEAATWIGSGSWSDCFVFVSQGRDLVVRIGPQGDDFAVDALVDQFATPQLKVPHVLLIGTTGHEHFAISQRVPGQPLEQANNGLDLVPPTVQILDALRSTRPELTGWGRWKPHSGGQAPTWRAFLLAVDTDPVTARTHGWKQKLATVSHAQQVFDDGYALLESTIVDDVPWSLVHNDLINRNVHVVGSTISGVFDWGNSLLGDHLYDIALMLFWQPWLPHLQSQIILDTALEHWSNAGDPVNDVDARLRTCQIHIALEHIAHNVSRDDWVEAQAVIDRMYAVIDQGW